MNINNMVCIFLDDVRNPPNDKWIVTRTAGAAYQAVLENYKAGKTIILSLDHDLGEDIPTGYDLLNWLEKDIVTDASFRPDIGFLIHSANPVGKDNMARAIKAIGQLLE